jgi:outer membrane lipoprotein-sorting protein
MKKKIPIQLSLIILLLFGGISQALQAQTPNAKSIVDKSYHLFLGKNSFSVMSMTIVRPSWQRTISMQNWSLGDAFYISLVTAPARDKGQVFLKYQKDMWNYIPAINRRIKIPPSMMMQSWMGSDFTNNDLMKQNSIITDYTHKITGEENYGNYTCWKIELTPLPEAAVVWGKIIVWIAKKNFNTLKMEFYDDHHKLIKTETASQLKMMGGRLLPSHLEMVSNTKSGNKTIIEIQHQEFNLRQINKSFFSIQNMQRLRPRKL